MLSIWVVVLIINISHSTHICTNNQAFSFIFWEGGLVGKVVGFIMAGSDIIVLMM